MVLKLDPTRTTTLRRAYEAEMRKRFYYIRSLIIQAIWKLDVLGLEESEPFAFNRELLVANQLPERQAWRFRTDAEKITSFQSWLTEQLAEPNAPLFVDPIVGDPWTAPYVHSSYRRGAVRSYTEMHPEIMAENPDFYQGSRQQFIESSFAQPEMTSKVQLLYTRSFEELKGITAAMSQQLSRVLADGMANGLSPRMIARNMTETITGITRQRAMTLARTEIIYAHSEGQLDALQQLGVEGVTADVEWSTAEDEKVCDQCADLEGTVFTIDEARGLIPRHPNCRCAWLPASVGEVQKGQARSLREKKKNVNDSLRSELPRKSHVGDEFKRIPQTVREAKRRSTWVGKELF